MSDHEEREEDGRRERAEDKAKRRGIVPCCDLCEHDLINHNDDGSCAWGKAGVMGYATCHPAPVK